MKKKIDNKTLAVIPASEGSKRIPKKNIKNFHGRPIIEYSIDACLNTGLFDKIVVSTDSEEIASVARRAGATVPFLRPGDLSDDYTGTTAVVRHAIEFLEEKGCEYDQVCCVYATAPFVSASKIREGYDILVRAGCDYVFSASEYPYPIQRSFNASGIMLFPEHLKSRSQDLEPMYHDAGQFYWGKSSSFKSGAEALGSNFRNVILPRKFVVDIDTPEDWELAELMAVRNLVE